jgi:hypothetical protein
VNPDRYQIKDKAQRAEHNQQVMELSVEVITYR